MLDRGVCFVISGLQLGGGCVELGGLAEEEAVGQRDHRRGGGRG